MIKRIVKLTFKKQEVDRFLAIFAQSKNKIKASPGCLHLELLQQLDEKNVFFTYSYWEDEAALQGYRESELFRSTWEKTKVLFSERPQAWSLTLVDRV